MTKYLVRTWSQNKTLHTEKWSNIEIQKTRFTKILKFIKKNVIDDTTICKTKFTENILFENNLMGSY